MTPELENQEAENQNPNPDNSTQPTNLDNQESKWLLERELYLSRIREQNIEIEQAKRNVPAPVAAVENYDEDNKKYWEKPIETLLPRLKQMIKGELDEQIKPLTSFVRQTKAQTDYDNLKFQFKNHPNYAYFPQVEASIDQQISQYVANGGVINIGIIDQAYTIAVGNALRQGLLNANPNVPNTPVKDTKVIPPSMPSSAPNVPSSTRSDNLDYNAILTETEKKIARINGMTLKDYYEAKQQDIMKLKSHGGN